MVINGQAALVPPDTFAPSSGTRESTFSKRHFTVNAMLPRTRDPLSQLQYQLPSGFGAKQGVFALLEAQEAGKFRRNAHHQGVA